MPLLTSLPPEEIGRLGEITFRVTIPSRRSVLRRVAT